MCVEQGVVWVKAAAAVRLHMGPSWGPRVHMCCMHVLVCAPSQASASPLACIRCLRRLMHCANMILSDHLMQARGEVAFDCLTFSCCYPALDTSSAASNFLAALYRVSTVVSGCRCAFEALTSLHRAHGGTAAPWLAATRRLRQRHICQSC